MSHHHRGAWRSHMGGASVAPRGHALLYRLNREAGLIRLRREIPEACLVISSILASGFPVGSRPKVGARNPNFGSRLGGERKSAGVSTKWWVTRSRFAA
jgi:hypothetical protein